MKVFLERYGLIIVLTIVIFAIIGVAIFLSQKGSLGINTIFNNIYDTGNNIQVRL